MLRGQWISGDRATTRDDLRRAALGLVGSDAFFTHDSAAELHGGITPTTDALHLGIPDDRRVRLPGLVVHRYLDRVPTTHARGFPVTTLPQTFIDLASRWPLVDLVVFGESIAQQSATAIDEFRSAASAGRGRSIRKARRAAALVVAGAESPYETRIRMLMTLAGKRSSGWGGRSWSG